jgi:BirA family transcriptional regulator, biotin operon repressor / biotin---[acetyl-CoA-carboxylase] ligase
MDLLAQLRRQSAMDELQDQGWLRHVEWLSEVDSTNSLAKRWYTDNEDLTPALFVADQQTAGRGRGGNQWWSPSGCLMLTLAVPFSELPNDRSLYPQLALVTGVALAATADAVLSEPNLASTKLKWPNDAYLDGRKLAGILIEALQTRSCTTGFAIGIGINTDMDWREASIQLRERAVCLSSVAGRAVDRETVLVELIKQLSDHLAVWRERPEAWLSIWRSRCLLTGCVVKVRVGASDELVGRCEGIDAVGRLLIRTESQLHTLTACEILSWA